MEQPWGPASSSLRPSSNLLSSHNLQDHVLSRPVPPRWANTILCRQLCIANQPWVPRLISIIPLKWRLPSTYICSIPAPTSLWASSLATTMGLWKPWPPWLWGHQASLEDKNWHYSLALCQDMQKPSQNEQGKLQIPRKLPRPWRRTWTKPFGICMLWDLHGSLDTDSISVTSCRALS